MENQLQAKQLQDSLSQLDIGNEELLSEQVGAVEVSIGLI